MFHWFTLLLSCAVALILLVAVWQCSDEFWCSALVSSIIASFLFQPSFELCSHVVVQLTKNTDPLLPTYYSSYIRRECHNKHSSIRYGIYWLPYCFLLENENHSFKEWNYSSRGNLRPRTNVHLCSLPKCICERYQWESPHMTLAIICSLQSRDSSVMAKAMLILSLALPKILLKCDMSIAGRWAALIHSRI